MSGTARGQTPQSPTSSPSSTSHSTTQSLDLKRRGGSRDSAQSSSTNNTGIAENGYINGSNGDYAVEWEGDIEPDKQRRRRPRTSGGFLLGSIIPHQGLKRQSRGSEKGKEKANDTVVPERKLSQKRLHHRLKPSVGSSPLATEVVNTTPTIESPGNRHQDQDDNPRISSTARYSDNDLSGADFASDPGRNSGQDASPPRSPGLDTDPAQIVKLALNLSESRRRNFSAGLLSPIDVPGSRRVVSIGQLGAGYPTSTLVNNTGGSLKQHLQQQRRISRNISPRSDKLARTGAASPSAGSFQDQSGNLQPPAEPALNLTLIDDFNFNPSDATLARAEKARISLELFYEYRRLLQHLPKLPEPSKSRPSTAKIAAKKVDEPPPIAGRAYNPLQYVRNRKARARERKAFHAEEDGWKNLEKVRDWVTSVSNARGGAVSRLDNPLPVFASQDTVPDGQSPASIVQRNNVSAATQPRRPRMEWITTPWDLLADAYWLDQEDNKKHVEDRDGNKLFTIVRSSVEQPSRSSRDIARVPARRSDSMTRNRKSLDNTDGLVLDGQTNTIQDRGRRQHQLRSSITSLSDLGGSQDRKSRWHRKIMRSRSSSSSEGSRQDSISSLRRFPMIHDNRERQDSAVLEKQVMDLLAKEQATKWTSPWDDQNPATHGEEETYADASQKERSNGSPKQFENVSLEKARRRKTDLAKLANNKSLAETGLEDQRGRRPRTPNSEVEMIASNSPMSAEFVPTISINLSPSGSRSSSPKKRLPFPLPFKGRSGHSKERQPTGESDFAIDVELSNSGPRRDLHEMDSNLSPIASATTSSDGLLSPKSAESFGRSIRHQRSDSNLTKDTKASKEESRFRGLLKGGRIAGIVGNEVSRVGGLLWRRDHSNNPTEVYSPTSTHGSDISGSEEEVMVKPSKTTSSTRLSRFTTNGEDEEKLSRKITNQEQPKYHMNNLPTFKSPSRKDDSSLNASDSSLGHDHISRQQMALRERGRPSRFERLLPPRMDTRGTSYSPSSSLTRVRTTDSEATYDDSRRNSSVPSEQGSRRADRRFSRIPGRPRNLEMPGLPVTGLSALDTGSPRSGERPTMDGKRQWSISDRGISAVRGTVTKRDITRVRALLLSTGVKANEIVRRAEEVREQPSAIIQALQRDAKAPFPRIARAKEHVFAARMIIGNMDKMYKDLRDTADQFSHTTVNGLHDEIKAIDHRITTQLTSLVRASADDADALSSELASSHHVTVKRLNASIDAIMRRRRRRLRWMKKGAYWLLEWLLVLTMWFVWSVVVVIRLTRVAVVTTIRAVKWLLWL